MMSPRLKARIAGLLYLIVIAGGLFSEMFVRGRLVVAGDAQATAYNIVAHERLYRWGFAAEIFYCACNVPLNFILYDLFKVVNRSVTLLAVAFALVGTGIEAVSLLAHYAPLVFLGGAPYLSAFSAEQLQAAAYTSLRMFEYGFAVTLVFFGGFCLCLGYVILKSDFFPRIIGALLAVEGLCYLINSFANFLAPAFAARFFPVLMASAVAELSLCGWLLVAGVNVQRWQAQAEAAGLK
jgi:hypothetical protein